MCIRDRDLAVVIAQIITDINSGVTRHGLELVEGFAQQYLLDKGLKLFGKKGEDATYKEMEQLHKQVCFTPIDISKLLQEEKKKAQMVLLFLTEKRDGSIKGHMVYNGKPTRDWLS